MAQKNDQTAKKPKRVKKTYEFPYAIAELIESHKYATEGCEIDFVSEAIRNHCADIDGEKSVDVMCERMGKMYRAEINNHSNRMAHLLFKIAVELAIQNHLLAAGYVDLTENEMRQVRNKASDYVRRSRGFLSFEKALEEERELNAGD
jgi:hypothetical protein